MSLMTLTNLIAQTDYLGASFKKLKSIIGLAAAQSAPVLGTVQNWGKLCETMITTTVADYQQQADMLADFHTTLANCNVENVARALMQGAVDTLNKHTQGQGSTVDATINSLATFLSYYNGGNGGALFNKMTTPDFGDLYFAIKNSRLPPAGVMSPAIHPTFNASASANGLAARQIGIAMVAGDDVNTALYSAVVPLLEVVTTFVNGSVPPAYTIVGTDHLGLVTAQWTVNLTGNNPTSVVNTTITPALTAQARQTFAVASATGIVVGSVLKINAGLVDEEAIVVETVAGANITAAVQLAHLAGAALTGNATYALTPVNGARITHVTSITPVVTGTDTGKVRIVGRQDRVGV